MIESRDDLFLWVEKYRPQKIDECVLPESLKQTFREYVSKGQLPTFLFCGTAGVGKTTIAKALCNEVGADFIMINGSDEGRSIDTLRTTIKNFASTVSLTDAKKVVIVDEADYMNAESVQPALRNFIEQFSGNCSFIFTCNFKNRIIEPLHSRCAVIEFKIESKDKQEIAATFFKRAAQILKQENIEFDPKVVSELIIKHFPDYRRILNELQRYSVSGKIDSGILVNLQEVTLKTLMTFLKERDYTNMRKWVAENIDNDANAMYRMIFDQANQYITKDTIPAVVLIVGKYQYQHAFAADAEINLVCCLTEIMMEADWK